MPIEVVESHVQGKNPNLDCEDVLVQTDSFVAVIDGATDETGATFDGRSGGRFAADTIAAALTELPHASTARQFADAVTTSLRQAVEDVMGGMDASTRWPSASLACLSVAHRQVWRIGDCPIAIGAHRHDGVKRVDDAAYGFRAAINAALLERGTDMATILIEDPGAHATRPLFDLQQHLANTVGPWGFGCVNGTPVPDDYIEVFAIGADIDFVVLTSDGYPEPAPTLEAAERALADLIEADPAAVGPAWTMGKSMPPGNVAPDDRSYVRVRMR